MLVIDIQELGSTPALVGKGHLGESSKAGKLEIIGFWLRVRKLRRLVNVLQCRHAWVMS